ncbi:MAG: bifunctional hydroxymethylpyrimidine kinase/phosphomethylpyrimidine kinase [Hyphomonadaceae bacterium]
MKEAKGRVLIIAGSDSGGGAGVQADIKTVTALGSYAMSAITAVTVQNTLGVSAIHSVPPDIVRAQIDAVMADLGADCWKIGMLGGVETVEAVGAAIAAWPGQTIVLDPVMIAKGGAALLEDAAVEALRALLPAAALVTPNAPEAARLAGLAVHDLESQKRAAEALVKQGARAALVKGGHIDSPVVRDVLLHAGGMEVFQSPRLHTKATHGTGCTLASAIAVGLAQGLDLGQAVPRARAYLMEAIARAPGLGRGHGPLGHGWPFSPVA